MDATARTVIDPRAATARERYHLLTSLVVPRPIGWLSTRSAHGVANLAPFSYFAALAASPMLVGVSIGHRGGRPKDSLRNILDTGVFCVNLATEPLLDAMNASSAEYPPEVDEFAAAGLEPEEAGRIDAPFVAASPAVLLCELFREVGLGDAPNTLVIGEVVEVRLDPALSFLPETLLVDPAALRPVARLGGDYYATTRDLLQRPRPARPL